MKQREKTHDTVIRREERTDGKNSYSYELLIKESLRVASYKMPLYSIRVGMTNEFGDFTTADIKDAFADAGRAIFFFEKIVNNLATPIDLAYILEDEMR